MGVVPLHQGAGKGDGEQGIMPRRNHGTGRKVTVSPAVREVAALVIEMNRNREADEAVFLAAKVIRSRKVTRPMIKALRAATI